MNENKTPIAVFAYNRPQHLRRALVSLANCARLDECRLYLFCDGPKDASQLQAVKATRGVVEEWAPRLGAAVVEKLENLGLARSITAGVTELCAQYGRVIIVEDDLVVHPSFVNYMLTALDLYEDVPQVFQISGFMYPIECLTDLDALFLPLTTTWGWATWQRAWSVYDPDVPGAREQLARPAVRRRFNLDDAYPYAEMLEDMLAGKNDSWGIAFWWAVFQAQGVVLYPRCSLVWQGGTDASGTHGDAPSVLCPDWRDVMETRWRDSWRFPPDVLANQIALDCVKELLRSRHKWTVRLAHRIKREFARFQSSLRH